MKKHKTKSDKLSNNESPNVLVLPPKLLEKLGISLGNIDSAKVDVKPKEHADVRKNVKDSCINSKNINDLSESDLNGEPSFDFESSSPTFVSSSPQNNLSLDETSIMKTANLMKKSVFLSPTFSYSRSHLEPNSSEDVISSCNIPDINVKNLEPTHIGDGECSKIESIVDTHKFDTDTEKEQLDCCNQDMVNVNKNASKKLKINVISEEIIAPTECRPIRHSPKGSTLIPVSIDSVIIKAKSIVVSNNQDSEEESRHIDSCSDHSNMINDNTLICQDIHVENEVPKGHEDNILSTDSIKQTAAHIVKEVLETSEVEINTEVCNVEMSHDNLQNELNTYKENNTDKQGKNNVLMEIENKNKEKMVLANEMATVTESNIGIKPKYLENVQTSTPVDIQQIVSSNNDLIDPKVNKSGNDNEVPKVTQMNEVISSNTDTVCRVNRRAVQPKSCIQGVEKPGGETNILLQLKIEDNKRTYSRRVSNVKLSTTSRDIPKENLANIDYNITENNDLYDSDQLSKFCICSDYGYLKNYDEDCSQHIHFFNQRALGCSLDTVFSIFYDHSNFDYKEICTEEISSNISDSQSENNPHICFNDIMLEDNIDATDGNCNEITNVCKVGNENNGEGIVKEMVPNSGISLSSPMEEPKPDDCQKSFCKTNTANATDCEMVKKTDVQPEKRQHQHSIQKRKRLSSDESPLINLKRSRTQTTEPDSNQTTTFKQEPIQPHETVCGICDESIDDSVWFEHISTKHSYLAWKKGDIPLDFSSDSVVKEHLTKMLNMFGVLVCGRCGLAQKNIRKYLYHVNACDAEPGSVVLFLPNSELGAVSKCSVCKEEVTDWFGHIGKMHNYLAWKDGETPVDLSNKLAVCQYLGVISEQNRGLVCSKCGCRRKYVKAYLHHILHCDGEQNMSMETSINNSMTSVKCGVCNVEVTEDMWIDHIQSKHNYMAWRHGETPLDVNDKEAVHTHLYNISKQINGLVCSKCGCRRKYVKAFLHHIDHCDDDEQNTSVETSIRETSIPNSIPPVICGVCNVEVIEDMWMDHVQREHNYLAWVHGETPLDLNDTEAVHNHLYNISKRINGLICPKCGCMRKYVKLYLKHISQCTGDVGNSSIEMTPNTRRHHRRHSVTALEDTPNKTVDIPVALIKCGVCEAEIEDSEWITHIQQEHDYLAWKQGDTPLDIKNKEALYTHLYNISKQNNGLICSKCGICRIYVKSYLHHIKSCKENYAADFTNDSIANSTTASVDLSMDSEIVNTPVKCGVCKKTIENRSWIDHIAADHNYLAWTEDDKPLDLNDEEALRLHLYDIIQKHGPLTCNICGLCRKYAKSFLSHIASCSAEQSTTEQEDVDIKCGVCNAELKSSGWENHIMRVHKYVAWIEGQTPIDATNEEAVHDHLYALSKKFNGLRCSRCGVIKKYVKSYNAHVESCNAELQNYCEGDGVSDLYECALCHEKGPMNDFKNHAMDQHYNVAWMVGTVPIDVKNITSIERFLKDYKKKYKKLECKNCGLIRASLAGFFAHVIQCGHSEEETEIYKSLCEICNNKYVGVYKYSHMITHRVQEESKLKKLKAEEPTEVKEEDRSSVRKAAKKAQKVIKKFTTEMPNDGLKSDDEGEYSPVDGSSSSSDSEIHAEIEPSSDNASPESEPNVSDDEEKTSKPKKSAETIFMTTNLKRIPFSVRDPASYIANSFRDFSRTHFTTSTLFPHWLTCDYALVPDNELVKYMPPLKESCRVEFASNPSTTYNLFEARLDFGTSLFVGACIQSVGWVPCRSDEEEQARAYLVVNCHNGIDSPRVQSSQVLQHPGLIQIWDFQNMNVLPSFAFGLAHDYGTVWGMDWCPSGACELLSDETEGFTRMGLLAVACSNGSAYIFSVPHPDSIIKDDVKIFRLKPVAELKMFRDDDRNCQATAISWSPQKDHSCILVGYANGMMAAFDLNGDSPLLTDVKEGVKIYYPFFDERPHTACITDVKIFSSGSKVTSNWSGAVSASSACGASASLGGTGWQRAGETHLQLTAEKLLPIPHWPAPILAGNSDIITQAINEIDWWGAGRRIGSMSTACGCLVCSRVAAFFPPLLKTMFVNPVFHDRRDIKVKARIDIISLEKSKNEQETSKASSEPSNYEDAIKRYGVKFSHSSSLKKNDLSLQMNKPKPRNVERYPLADVTSMSFCSLPKYHRKLAIAIHSGMIFVINA
ncbi:unnamed protein product [Leptosia nina]|uniref:C2H2-type domain-containing protein n=1 Tax=Leptosia nina TaxID=320188 RepID=A0AAV1JNK8_9NEOP